MVTTIQGHQKFSFHHRMGEVGEQGEVEFFHAQNLSPGDDVELTVAGQPRRMKISGVSRELGPTAPMQRVALLSPLAGDMEKASKKRLVFSSVPSMEWYDSIASDIPLWEYTPFMKVGGWKAHEIITELARLAGLTAVVQTPNYWVENFVVDTGTPLYSAIVELTKIYNPAIYNIGGTIFIFGGMEFGRDILGDTSYVLQNARLVREERVTKSLPSQIVVEGSLGLFRLDRHKGPMYPPVLFPLLATVGGLSATNFAYGSITEQFTFDTGNLPFNQVPGLTSPEAIDPDTMILPDYSRVLVTNVYGLAIFGNKGFLHFTQKVEYKWRLVNNSWAQVQYSVEEEAYLMEDTAYVFARPREVGNSIGTSSPAPSKIQARHQCLWFPTESGDPEYKLVNNVEVKRTYNYYDGNQRLITSETTIRSPLYTEDDEEYRLLSSMQKDDVGNGRVKYKGSGMERTVYSPVSRDSYAVTHETFGLDAMGRLRLRSSSQSIQNAQHPMMEREFRQAQTYAETGAAEVGNPDDMFAIMDTPAQRFQIKSPSWEDCDNTLEYLQTLLGADEVIRTYECHGELNVQLGSPVSMPQETHRTGESVSAPPLAPGFHGTVIGYEVEKGTGEQGITRITIRGRLT